MSPEIQINSCCKRSNKKTNRKIKADCFDKPAAFLDVMIHILPLKYTNKLDFDEKEIDEIEQRIKEVRASYMAPRAIQYNDMPKAHNTPDLSDYYARVEIYVDMLLEREKELIGVNADIMMTVDRIADPDERRVLMLRYVDQKQWIEIARAIPVKIFGGDL